MYILRSRHVQASYFRRGIPRSAIHHRFPTFQNQRKNEQSVAANADVWLSLLTSEGGLPCCMNKSLDLPPPLPRAGKRISRAFKSGWSLFDAATDSVMLFAVVMYIRILHLPASSRLTMDIRFDTTADRTVYAENNGKNQNLGKPHSVMKKSKSILYSRINRLLVTTNYKRSQILMTVSASVLTNDTAYEINVAPVQKISK